MSILCIECNAVLDQKIDPLGDICKKCIDNPFFIYPIHNIIDGLFLGDMNASKKINFLEENKISHILVAGRDLECHFPEKFVYKVLKLDDNPKQDIKQHFDDAYCFIHEARTTGGAVFVHCAAGVSRSATIVIAYLMKLNKWGFRDSWNFVKTKRDVVNPNLGFKEQLSDYEFEIL